MNIAGPTLIHPATQRLFGWLLGPRLGFFLMWMLVGGMSPDLTVLENVMIPCFAKRDGAFRLHAFESVGQEGGILEQAEAILSDVNMLEKRNMHAGSLSRGDKRRLEMAMCLVQEPKLLLLDEPTAGMARADTNNTMMSPPNFKRTTTSFSSRHPQMLHMQEQSRIFLSSRLETWSTKLEPRCSIDLLLA